MEKGEHSLGDSGSRVWGRRWWQAVFQGVEEGGGTNTEEEGGGNGDGTREWRRGEDGGGSQAEGGEGGAGTDIEEWSG